MSRGRGAGAEGVNNAASLRRGYAEIELRSSSPSPDPSTELSRYAHHDMTNTSAHPMGMYGDASRLRHRQRLTPSNVSMEAVAKRMATVTTVRGVHNHKRTNQSTNSNGSMHRQKQHTDQAATVHQITPADSAAVRVPTTSHSSTHPSHRPPQSSPPPPPAVIQPITPSARPILTHAHPHSRAHSRGLDVADERAATAAESDDERVSSRAEEVRRTAGQRSAARRRSRSAHSSRTPSVKVGADNNAHQSIPPTGAAAATARPTRSMNHRLPSSHAPTHPLTHAATTHAVNFQGSSRSSQSPTRSHHARSATTPAIGYDYRHQTQQHPHQDNRSEHQDPNHDHASPRPLSPQIVARQTADVTRQTAVARGRLVLPHTPLSQHHRSSTDSASTFASRQVDDGDGDGDDDVDTVFLQHGEVNTGRCMRIGREMHAELAALDEEIRRSAWELLHSPHQNQHYEQTHQTTSQQQQPPTRYHSRQPHAMASSSLASPSTAPLSSKNVTSTSTVSVPIASIPPAQSLDAHQRLSPVLQQSNPFSSLSDAIDLVLSQSRRGSVSSTSSQLETRIDRPGSTSHATISTQTDEPVSIDPVASQQPNSSAPTAVAPFSSAASTHSSSSSPASVSLSPAASSSFESLKLDVLELREKGGQLLRKHQALRIKFDRAKAIIAEAYRERDRNVAVAKLGHLMERRMLRCKARALHAFSMHSCSSRAMMHRRSQALRSILRWHLLRARFDRLSSLRSYLHRWKERAMRVAMHAIQKQWMQEWEKDVTEENKKNTINAALTHCLHRSMMATQRALLRRFNTWRLHALHHRSRTIIERHASELEADHETMMQLLVESNEARESAQGQLEALQQAHAECIQKHESVHQELTTQLQRAEADQSTLMQQLDKAHTVMQRMHAVHTTLQQQRNHERSRRLRAACILLINTIGRAHRRRLALVLAAWKKAVDGWKKKQEADRVEQQRKQINELQQTLHQALNLQLHDSLADARAALSAPPGELSRYSPSIQAQQRRSPYHHRAASSSLPPRSPARRPSLATPASSSSYTSPASADNSLSKYAPGSSTTYHTRSATTPALLHHIRVPSFISPSPALLPSPTMPSHAVASASSSSPPAQPMQLHRPAPVPLELTSNTEKEAPAIDPSTSPIEAATSHESFMLMNAKQTVQQQHEQHAHDSSASTLP